MFVEKIALTNDNDSELTAYIQEVEGEFQFKKRPAIIVIPGGGYMACSKREQDGVAFAYLKAGYQAFILNYHVGRDVEWPTPLNDYEKAYEIIEEKANEWFIDTDRISVVGFSAGGHLAGCAATIAKHKPKAAVLVYPAIMREILDICAISNLPELHTKVDENTSPCFIVAARDDRVVNVINSLHFELALEKYKVPFESHIYSYGGHGFSTAESWIVTSATSKRVPRWVEDSVDWLNEVQGTLVSTGFTKAEDNIWIDGVSRENLSVNCSLKHLNNQNDDVANMLTDMYAKLHVVADLRSLNYERLLESIENNTMRELMEMLGYGMDEIQSMNEKLCKIVNME